MMVFAIVDIFYATTEVPEVLIWLLLSGKFKEKPLWLVFLRRHSQLKYQSIIIIGFFLFPTIHNVFLSIFLFSPPFFLNEIV